MIRTWMCGGRTSETVSEAKPTQFLRIEKLGADRRSGARRGMDAEYHFCEVFEAEAGSHRPGITSNV
ncbi:hypothetical protein ACFL4M_00310 [Pseudomonadota bacterium]